MSKLFETCKGGPSSTAALSPNAGAAGAAGASGGGTAGSLGAGAAGGGNGTPSAAAASDDEGCSVTAVGARRGAFAGAALFLAGLLSTRFRARRGADGSARR